MAAKMTTLHSQEIIKAQLNGKSEEEYTKEVKQIIIENINDLFYDSNLTMRQFAVQVGISHSSLARILERKVENIKLDTLCKIGANLGVPIQNLITSKKDRHSTKKMKYIANFSGDKDSMATSGKKSTKKRIEQSFWERQQMSIEDFLKPEEEKEKK